MAYETGTATDYRDLWKKIITFLTQNADLVSAGEEWALTRGYVNPDITYIQSKEREKMLVKSASF